MAIDASLPAEGDMCVYVEKPILGERVSGKHFFLRDRVIHGDGGVMDRRKEVTDFIYKPKAFQFTVPLQKLLSIGYDFGLSIDIDS
jgi:hypothetical protein